MLKSSVGNTKGKKIMLPEEKRNEQKIKNYLSLEWILVYVKEDGTLLLIFAKTEGKGKSQVNLLPMEKFAISSIRIMVHRISISTLRAQVAQGVYLWRRRT